MKIAVILLGLLAGVFAFPAEPAEEIDVASLKPRHIWLPAPGPLPENNNPSSRIINGRNAAPGTLGYQAGLLMDNSGFCGGSLIRSDFVLTAAHCVDTAFETQVILGSHSIFDSLAAQQVVRSREHFVHPQWNPSVLQNDVALVGIPRVNPNNPTIQIIRLAAGNSPSFSGSIATLSGWGRESDDSTQIARQLQVIDLEVLSNFRCRLNFLGLLIEDQHICTSGSNGNTNVGACNGDSGGPLVVNGVQVGIVSFGFARCEAGWPSVFARVSSFIDYILTVLNNPN